VRGGVHRLGEGYLSAKDADGGGARNGESAPAVHPTQPLKVGDLARCERKWDLFPDRVPADPGDRPGGRRVARSSVATWGGPMLVHDLDRTLLGEQLVDDPIAIGRVAGPHSEKDMPGREPMMDLAREERDRLGGLEISLGDAGRPDPDRVAGLRAGVDPDDDFALAIAGFERVFDRRLQRSVVSVERYCQDAFMVDGTSLRRGRQDDGDAFGDPLPREKAHRRPASLPQKARELPVESRVPRNERDRPMSHRRALTVKYRIYLAAGVPVCLHCGQIAPDGALFCPKCGFTLPQGDGTPGPSIPRPAAPYSGSASPSAGSPTSPPLSSPTPPSSVSPTAIPMPPPTDPATAPPAGPNYFLTRIPPPPNGKYCVRCGTLISRPAVYCPVCQQPQGP
jgi:RNA polymerase subunit RPABC4/transcription elongation factor Spt4